jgi:hypothetical protein
VTSTDPARPDVFAGAPAGAVTARLGGAGAATLALAVVLVPTGPRTVVVIGLAVFWLGVPATVLLERRRPTVERELAARRYARVGALLGVAVWAVLAALDPTWALLYAVAPPAGALAGWVGTATALRAGPGLARGLAVAAGITVLLALLTDVTVSI